MIFEPCPRGLRSVVDLGHGVRIRFSRDRDGVAIGLIQSHERPDGAGRCSGYVILDVPEAAKFQHAGAVGDGVLEIDVRPRQKWRVVCSDPLTLEPSLRCERCGHDGRIRDGRWVPAQATCMFVISTGRPPCGEPATKLDGRALCAAHTDVVLDARRTKAERARRPRPRPPRKP